MYGFLILAGMLLINVLGCGAAFFVGQTALIVPLAVTFFVLYGLTAFPAGRGVELRSPFAPRTLASPERTKQVPQRRRPPAASDDADFGLLE